MEVSLGLISKLVKCKSIERAVAPIASQVSLLIILSDHKLQNCPPQNQHNPEGSADSGNVDELITNGRDPTSVLSVPSCAANMAVAVDQFMALGERESDKSKNKLFTDHMKAAIETVDLAKTNLVVTSQRFEIDPNSDGVRHALCIAARDVLQAVLKVLLVIDDDSIHSVVAIISEVHKNIGAVAAVESMENLLPAFRCLTESIIKLKEQVDTRRQDLRSSKCREQLTVSVNALRKCVPSLSMAMQTYLKYKMNHTAQGSRDIILQQMYLALTDVQNLIQMGSHDDRERQEEIQSFVSIVNDIIDTLSEEHRHNLNPDFEGGIVSLVQHSMSVAHFYWGSYREIIFNSCHRVLQAKFRLMDLNDMVRENPGISGIRVEYDSICETMLDEVCDLEKHVVMTLVHLIVDSFVHHMYPLDSMVKAALSHEDGGGSFSEVHKALIKKFSDHSDLMCQVSSLVAGSSIDLSRVGEIALSITCLETLDPDIIQVVTSIAHRHRDPATVRHLKLLVKRWEMEMNTVLKAIDKITDPRVFLDITVQKISLEVQNISAVQDKTESSRKKQCITRCLGLAERAAQLGSRLVDSNTDPIYRNGLKVFIQKLTEAISLARAAAHDVLTNKPSSKLSDTFDRRLKLLKGSVEDLRKGLDSRNHPDLLSQERKLVRQRSTGLMHGQRSKNDLDDTDKTIVCKAERMNAGSSSVTKLTAAFETMMIPAPDIVSEDGDTCFDVGTKVTALQEAKVERVGTWPAKIQSEARHLSDEDNITKGCHMEAQAAKDDGTHSNIHLLVNRLLTAAKVGDKITAENLTNDLLGWTNHIVEASEALSTHCSNLSKSSDLKRLARESDQLAPEVIQIAKFLVSGSKDSIDNFFHLASRWADKLDKARIIVDVAADRWLLLTDEIIMAVQDGQNSQLKRMLSAISSAQQEMGKLLLKSRFLTGHYLPNGPMVMEFLSDVLKDLENIAITIRTSVEVTQVSAIRSSNDGWQLVQVCRDWSVMMTCVVSELDKMSDAMEELGRQKFPNLGTKTAAKNSRLGEILQEETSYILELVDYVVYGDNILKTRSEELVTSLNDALTDLLTVARQPIASGETPQQKLFSRLRIGLARNRWLEKALEMKELIYQHALSYSGCVRQILHYIMELREEGEPESVIAGEQHRVGNGFLETSRLIKQKALSMVQLSSDLPKRAMIRTMLDRVSQLTTLVHGALKDPCLTEATVDILSEQWGALMKKLICFLTKLDGVRPGTIAEMERLTGTAPPKLKHRLSQGGNLSTSHDQLISAANSDLMSASFAHTSFSSPLSNTGSPVGKSAQVLLRNAQFLDTRLHTWEDGSWTWEMKSSDLGNSEKELNLSVIQHAIAMTKLCSNMALFTKGQGTLQSSQEMITAAFSVTRHSKLVEDLGRKLTELAMETRLAGDMVTCVNHMDSCRSQLLIIATALHNAAKTNEGDRILVRNASSLLTAVKEMFHILESIAVKGIQEPSCLDEGTRELIAILSKVRLQNEKYMDNEKNTQEIDDLGLRRVEAHKPPTLTSLVEMDGIESS